ncbi:Cobalt-precorrin-5B C(1)-methyltransferase [Desulfonema limicola]|uniref:Cobalt-precorrin-5B C(1)-methyltransferase n=1 Tax=Desulfonema limicola TaxID=45656 RepID=A0A975BD41_9BACT|nr:cobalt-precorrin-5B (C(1))-methyltransferase CbiD [Desulfonema limicola]QTA83060.1 Cobalt-precorrin-5B C(1)-methyltransferase [Desulfonema limicola]
MTSRKTRLKTGFTTGTAAAAAVKGGLYLIIEKQALSDVQVKLLTGDQISIPINTCRSISKYETVCTVIKDAGDDPDITHNAMICARVAVSKADAQSITIRGGRGVGKVTRPGLEIPPGEPAINPGPLQMIRDAVKDVLKDRQYFVFVEIFVPHGEELAKKTLNPRLGITGGISILGTTGIVKPMSHEAYIATIRSALSVAKASGLLEAVFTTGRRSEKYAQNLWPDLPEYAFIQIGDYFKLSLNSASDLEFKKIRLAVFFGKAVKMAQGIPHTHAAKSSLTMHKLSEWAFDITKNRELADKILTANTARHAFEFISKEYPEIIDHVGQRMIQSAKTFSSHDLHISATIFDFNGNPVFDSENA